MVLGGRAVEGLAGLGVMPIVMPQETPGGEIKDGGGARASASPLPDPAFWSGRRVLLTGHSGFKGGWTALWLRRLGARVTGIALPPETPSLHALARVGRHVAVEHVLDLRDQGAVANAVRLAEPEIVLHLAAQPLVRRSLAEPVPTFATNVMGTLHLLEALRHGPPPAAILVVTTDKVYAPAGHPHGYAETDPLGGEDPYAASKAACEMAVAAMARNFLIPAGIPVGVARAGNVVGGGDFAADRLIPDIVRAVRAGQQPIIRHPGATRPWQHVLDCISGYLLHAQALAACARSQVGADGAGSLTTAARANALAALNFGPADGTSLTVAAIADATLRAFGRDSAWISGLPDKRETHALALDSTLARQTLGWRERLSGPALIDLTTAWYRAWADGADMHDFTLSQIAAFEALP